MSRVTRSGSAASDGPRRPLLRGALAVLLLLSSAGCGLIGSDPQDPFDASGPGSKTIRIEVLNLNFNDATLHAFRGGERQRLGTVTGKGEATYTIEWEFSLPLRVEIDLLAGPRCITRPLQVEPGDIIDLQIPVSLNQDPDCVQSGRIGA